MPDHPAVFHRRCLLKNRITSCIRCHRLASFLAGHRAANPDWWCKPVPGFGDPNARLIILGLAPGLKGANRTGRPFTGDAAGVWLYKMLYEKRLANLGEVSSRKDGLGLRGVYIANAVKCVPPGNRPTSTEVKTCRPYLAEELKKLRQARAVLCLGKISHDALLATRRDQDPSLKLKDFAFGHGAIHELPGHPHYLIDSYHTSRLNTNTGRLTWEMWDQALTAAMSLAELS